jgi:predicted AAA+ superfamily ATPase
MQMMISRMVDMVLPLNYTGGMNTLHEAANAAAFDLDGLSLFAGVGQSVPLRAFRELLFHIKDDASGLVIPWAGFMRELAGSRAASFYHLVAHLTLSDDNLFTRAAETCEEVPPFTEALARADLCRLGRIALFDISALGVHIAEALRNAGAAQSADSIADEAQAAAARTECQTLFPAQGDWGDAGGVRHFSGGADTAAESAARERCQTLFPAQGDWGASLPVFRAYIHAHGAGELGQYHAFRWNTADGALQPVRKPDPVRLRDLAGYEEQRSIVIDNTRRFLEGKSANNLLLYGDRGTGKSATVKAVCNEFAEQGLRLLELPKQGLTQLPLILETLSSRAPRFVLFIDDLAFEALDDSFTLLKMLLEGDVEARPANVVVYATSNRRHLVREQLADRPNTTLATSGDMRAFDTMQEQFSLSDRFGLTVVFTAPTQEEFLSIAEHIAFQRGILEAQHDEARRVFRENALRWERWFNGRSPRTAVQYVDWLAGGVNAGNVGGAAFPWETPREVVPLSLLKVSDTIPAQAPKSV